MSRKKRDQKAGTHYLPGPLKYDIHFSLQGKALIRWNDSNHGEEPTIFSRRAKLPKAKLCGFVGYQSSFTLRPDFKKRTKKERIEVYIHRLNTIAIVVAVQLYKKTKNTRQKSAKCQFLCFGKRHCILASTSRCLSLTSSLYSFFVVSLFSCYFVFVFLLLLLFRYFGFSIV